MSYDCFLLRDRIKEIQEKGSVTFSSTATRKKLLLFAKHFALLFAHDFLDRRFLQQP